MSEKDQPKSIEAQHPNPYLPPLASQTGHSTASADGLAGIARRTFLAWEKLRILYIAIPATLVLLAALSGPQSPYRFWRTVIEGALFANACYFLGPVVETTLAWLGARTGWIRIGLFILGTVLTNLLAMAVLFGLSIPDMD